MVEENEEMVKNKPVKTKIKIQKPDVVQYNRNWLKIAHANRHKQGGSTQKGRGRSLHQEPFDRLLNGLDLLL